VLGAVSRLGYQLSENEKNELLAQIAVQPNVMALPDGNFVIKGAQAKQPNERSAGLLTSRQIDRELEKIKKSTEMKEAVIRAKRETNTRKRGKNFKRKGSRMMGKTHGKKKTFDQLLADIYAKEAERTQG
jgi:hypothetical protein